MLQQIDMTKKVSKKEYKSRMETLNTGNVQAAAGM